MTISALLDANVLYPAALRGFFMYLATYDLFRARWTEKIHDEWTRSLLRDRPDISPARVAQTRWLMDAHVEGASILYSIFLQQVTDYHPLCFMTKWHLNWQELFAVEYREIVMCNGEHKYRADLCLPQPDGSLLIVEFQHSRISVEKIRDREQFYTQVGHLLWVFDACKFNIRLEPTSSNGKIYQFTWSPPHKSLWAINSCLALDFGHVILLIAKAHERNGKRIPCGGLGWLYRRQEFVSMLHNFTMLFALDMSKLLWEKKTRRVTTPQLKAATKLVANADSIIIESSALQELKKQLPKVNQLALRGALAAACSVAGYVKKNVNQHHSAWVKPIHLNPSGEQ